jgi:hypothetical protein
LIVVDSISFPCRVIVTRHLQRQRKETIMKKHLWSLGTLAALSAGVLGTPAIAAASGDGHLIATASNTAANTLLIYDTRGTLRASIPTQGQGGVGGNSGGIAVDGSRLAVVNFGSGNVSVFTRDDSQYYRLEKVIQALASPVSVAFGHGHLYILSTTHVESHATGSGGVNAVADGAASLVVADGSAAQVGVLDHEVIVSEKSNVIETAKLDARGAVTGNTAPVANIPANVNAPFGLATHGDNAYVTIAHANEVSLVRNDTVLTTTGSGAQKAPCWAALDGAFLFTSNAASKTVSRFVVYGSQIVLDAPVVATLGGGNTDIAYAGSVAAVIDNNGTVSHVSAFKVDGDGNFTLTGVATIATTSTNGVAVIGND